MNMFVFLLYNGNNFSPIFFGKIDDGHKHALPCKSNAERFPLKKKTKGNCQPIHYKTAAPAQNHANIERNELVLPAMIPAYTEACLCLYLTRSGARWNVGTPPLAGRWWTERIKSWQVYPPPGRHSKSPTVQQRIQPPIAAVATTISPEHRRGQTGGARSRRP